MTKIQLSPEGCFSWQSMLQKDRFLPPFLFHGWMDMNNYYPLRFRWTAPHNVFMVWHTLPILTLHKQKKWICTDQHQYCNVLTFWCYQHEQDSYYKFQNQIEPLRGDRGNTNQGPGIRSALPPDKIPIRGPGASSFSFSVYFMLLRLKQIN